MFNGLLEQGIELPAYRHVSLIVSSWNSVARFCLARAAALEVSLEARKSADHCTAWVVFLWVLLSSFEPPAGAAEASREALAAARFSTSLQEGLESAVRPPCALVDPAVTDLHKRLRGRAASQVGSMHSLLVGLGGSSVLELPYDPHHIVDEQQRKQHEDGMCTASAVPPERREAAFKGLWSCLERAGYESNFVFTQLSKHVRT